MNISLGMHMVCSQKMLPEDPATSSIFKRVNKKLNSSAHQKALKFFGTFKKMGRYVDMVDFLFCECFPNPWRKKCFKYYHEEGCQLIEDPDMTPHLIDYYDKLMCFILDLAVWVNKHAPYEKRDRWKVFMMTVEQTLIENNIQPPTPMKGGDIIGTRHQIK